MIFDCFKSVMNDLSHSLSKSNVSEIGIHGTINSGYTPQISPRRRDSFQHSPSSISLGLSNLGQFRTNVGQSHTNVGQGHTNIGQLGVPNSTIYESEGIDPRLQVFANEELTKIDDQINFLFNNREKKNIETDRALH